MKNTAIEKLSYTEVTKNISQAEYNQTQEEYILSKSPDKYMISLPVKVLMFEGAKDSSPFTYYFYMENDEDLYLMQRKRNGSVVDKTKIPLTKEQGQKILDGDYQFLLDSDEPLLNSLYFQFTVNQLHPLYRKECTRKIFHQNRFLDEIVDIHIVRTPFEEDKDFFATHDKMLKGGKTKELQFCKLPKTIALYCLTTQTIYREGIFVPKPPRSPHPRLQLRPDEDFWYEYRLLQRFPTHW